MIKIFYCKDHDYIDGMEENEQNQENITINKYFYEKYATYEELNHIEK